MALCSNPYIPPSQIPAPCGKCKGCLVNRKQLWTHRIILESRCHDNNSFITLTYDDNHLPTNEDNIPTLNPDHLTMFIKNLRSKIPNKLRYYAVGEYGTAGERGLNPHFHLCLFGVGEEQYEEISLSWQKPKGRGKRKDFEPLGFTHTGSLTPQSAAYVAGYVQKKNQYNKDMYEELDIYPEFARMSNRPGIGAQHVKQLAKIIEANPEALTPAGDVPISLTHGKRTLPLGRYLREKVREELNMSHDLIEAYDPYTGEIIETKKWHAKELQKEIFKTELQDLQKNTQNDPKLPKDAKASLKHLLEYENAQGIKNFEARQRLYKDTHIL